jgi:hypothetical protein
MENTARGMIKVFDDCLKGWDMQLKAIKLNKEIVEAVVV